MTPKQTNKALIGALFLLIAALIAGLYFTNQRLTAVANETTKYATEIEVSKQQIKIYDLTKSKLKSLSETEEILGQILPEEEEQSLIVAELSGFARRSTPSLAVSGIEFRDPPDKSDAKKSKLPKNVKVIPMIVTFRKVRYEGVVDFLREVEDNRRTMQVHNIGLKQNEETKTAIDVTISMNLYAKNVQTGAKK